MKEGGQSKDQTLLSGWIAKDPATKLCLPSYNHGKKVDTLCLI